jgi:hypothetical protein
MFISNLTHYLDPDGNIAKEMPKSARELASFQSLIVDAATKDYDPPIMATEIRCRKKKCTGTIELFFDDEIIEWWCTDCNEAGRISGWQGSKWDNRK